MPTPPSVICSELSAAWCPVHGDCSCDRETDLNSPDCPLHRLESNHAIQPTPPPLTKTRILAEHRAFTDTMYNGFSSSYLTCACGWSGPPGDPNDAGTAWLKHILDLLDID